MSTAGAGDTLTGILAGSVLAGRTQKNGKENASYEFFEKICMGVYLHGRAGDAAADRFGNAGMKAMDIADAVAMCLKRTRHFLKLLYNTKKQIHKSEEKKNEE